jgi:hypothetical protein
LDPRRIAPIVERFKKRMTSGPRHGLSAKNKKIVKKEFALAGKKSLNNRS